MSARYRVMNWLCRGRQPTFVADLPGSTTGLRFEFNLHHDLAREVYFTGRYDAQEWALIRHFLKAGETFVDVSANIGSTSTLLAAEQVGPVRVGLWPWRPTLGHLPPWPAPAALILVVTHAARVGLSPLRGRQTPARRLR